MKPLATLYLLVLWGWAEAAPPTVLRFPSYEACSAVLAQTVDDPTMRAVSGCQAFWPQDKANPTPQPGPWEGL